MSEPANPSGDNTPSLWRGTGLNLASRIATMALGLAILVVVARQGPQVQGAFALFVAIEAALLALGSGLGLLLAREVAQRHGAVPAARVRALLRVAVAAGALAALVLWAVSRWADASPYQWLWLMALAAPLLLLAPTANGLWMGQGRLVALNLSQVAAPLLVLALLLTAGIAGHAGALVVLATWTIGKGLVGLATATVAWRAPSGAASTQALTPAPEALRFIVAIAVANVVSLANFRATLFVLERERGLAEAGVYSVALQVAELLWLLSQAVTVSAFPRIGAPEPAVAVATALHAVRIGVAAAAAAAPVLASLAWLVLPRVLGEVYRDALLPLLALAPGVAAYAAASALSAYFTHHRGRPHWAAGIAALSLAVTLSLAVVAVPRWGALGAALATSCAYLLAIAVALTLFRHDAGLSWRTIWRGDNVAPS